MLWVTYVLQTPGMKIFIGGDSGYDSHFKESGNNYDPFDLAILECGQYDKNWKYIHTLPDEIIQAAKDLQTKKWYRFIRVNFNWPIMPGMNPLLILVNWLSKIN